MKRKVSIPYEGHPVSALLRLHFVMMIRSLSAVFLNWVLILPVSVILLGGLPHRLPLIICLVGYLIADIITVGFREHDENLFHYNFVNRYGNHKLIYFTVYEFFVFAVNIGMIAFLVYSFLNGNPDGNQDDLLLPCFLVGALLPFIVTQFPAISGIKELSCKKCKRANIMQYESSGKTHTDYQIDYKTVDGYDTKVGEISYEGNNINVIQHVSRHKEFDGISRIDYHSTNYVCPICGYRKSVSKSYRTKVLK